MEQIDYYDILGLENNAGQKQIRDAYRRLALAHHPDRNRNNPEAAERMKELNEAYAVLSDPSKRREYDTLRNVYGPSAYGRYRQTHTDQDIFRGSDIQQVFEELSRAFGFRSFEDVFRESYGTGYRTFEFRRPGVFGRVFVGRVGEGPAGGRATLPGGHLEKLIRYGLKKKWGIELPERGKDLHDRISLSPYQARLGGRIRYTSKKAGKELLITLPPHARSGLRLRLKGMGESGSAGGEAGDLYVTVHVQSSLTDKLKELLARIRSFMNRI